MAPPRGPGRALNSSPILIALDTQSERLVHDLTKVIHIHYDEYKDADPGAIGWAMDRQLFDWVVPFHDGAVRYFKSIGVWNETHAAHNQRLITRQQVLADAWAKYVAVAPDDDAFASGWMKVRVAALEANDFDPVWR